MCGKDQKCKTHSTLFFLLEDFIHLWVWCPSLYKTKKALGVQNLALQEFHLRNRIPSFFESLKKTRRRGCWRLIVLLPLRCQWLPVFRRHILIVVFRFLCSYVSTCWYHLVFSFASNIFLLFVLAGSNPVVSRFLLFLLLPPARPSCIGLNFPYVGPTREGAANRSSGKILWHELNDTGCIPAVSCSTFTLPGKLVVDRAGFASGVCYTHHVP